MGSIGNKHADHSFLNSGIGKKGLGKARETRITKHVDHLLSHGAPVAVTLRLRDRLVLAGAAASILYHNHVVIHSKRMQSRRKIAAISNQVAVPIR